MRLMRFGGKKEMGKTIHIPTKLCVMCEVELKGFLKFNEIEDSIHLVIDPLEGQFLNNLPAFEKVNPTLEELSAYLFRRIDQQLESLKCELLRIEVGESPTRYYCLSK